MLQSSLAVGAGLTAFGGLSSSLFPRRTRASEAQKTLVVVFQSGGQNGIYTSADSFLQGEKFGVSSSNIVQASSEIFVDKTFADSMGPNVMSKMGVVGISHGNSGHEGGQDSFWNRGSRSYPLLLAAAKSSAAPIRAAQIGAIRPVGAHFAESGVSLQSIRNLETTITAFRGDALGSPSRAHAARGMGLASSLSDTTLAQSGRTLSGLRDAYRSGIGLLESAPLSIDEPTLRSAYRYNATDVSSMASKFAAAEVMVRSGCPVVIVHDDFVWDTHADISGSIARGLTEDRLLPSLSTFLNRVIPDPELDTTVVLGGEFLRSLPGSDHALVAAFSVFGKRILGKTTGRVNAEVGLPNLVSGYDPFWSFLADVLGAENNPFGAHPHGALLGV